MPQKYTYEQVKTVFSNQGWTLLSNIYINNKQKLRVKCSNNHVLFINLNNFLTGWRCTECYGKRYLNLDRIKKEFCRVGYKILTKHYVNSAKKLKFVCNKGHIHKMSYNAFQRGRRCGVCNDRHKTFTQVKQIFKKEKCKLLSRSYKNIKQKLKYRCKNGHIRYISLNQFLGGQRCRICFENISGKNHRFWKGGLSFLPYSLEFTKQLKYQIRQRDNFTCQHCGMTEENHTQRLKCDLHVHHIDYDKQNCKEDNLITLCAICHTKSNFNRDYWYAYYKYIMEMR